MKEEIQNCMSWLVNSVAPYYVYKWRENKELIEYYDEFYDELEKHIDFNNLTIDEALELRFKLWDEDTDLYLFPLYLVPIIPQGIEVTSIRGETYEYDKDTADNDIRFGCVAYGLVLTE